jgi:hypothetical protein
MDTREVVAPDTMPLERLEAEITELAGHLAAGECRWLQLIAEYDRRAGYEQWGCYSVVRWLGWHCGLDARARATRSGSRTRSKRCRPSRRSSRRVD